jgi:hypothetical protein
MSRRKILVVRDVFDGLDIVAALQDVDSSGKGQPGMRIVCGPHLVVLQFARANASKGIVGRHGIRIEVNAQLSRGPEDEAEERRVSVDGDKVAAGIGDDAAAIAVPHRESRRRGEVPGGEKSVDLGLLVEGLIVRCRSRCCPRPGGLSIDVPALSVWEKTLVAG